MRRLMNRMWVVNFPWKGGICLMRTANLPSLLWSQYSYCTVASWTFSSVVFPEWRSCGVPEVYCRRLQNCWCWILPEVYSRLWRRPRLCRSEFLQKMFWSVLSFYKRCFDRWRFYCRAIYYLLLVHVHTTLFMYSLDSIRTVRYYLLSYLE